MAKTIYLGDTHGRTKWNLILKSEKYDKLVFIGDYWDSHYIPFKQQKHNFNRIVELKRKDPDNIILLYGNHDYHYIGNETYSGFQSQNATEINELMYPLLEEGLFQLCYKDENDNFSSHAGISLKWLEEECYLANLPVPETANDIEKTVNKLFKESEGCLNFRGFDPYGDSINSSPIWIRPNSLINFGISYTQIVGHTVHKEITNTENVWFIDSLEYDNYLIVDNGKFIKKQI